MDKLYLCFLTIADIKKELQFQVTSIIKKGNNQYLAVCCVDELWCLVS